MASQRTVRSVLAWVVFGIVVTVSGTGCAHRIWNAPIGRQAMDDRYEFRNRLPKNSQDIFVVLAFSGGGTRAASFSYGVLEALRDTTIKVDGAQRRLLDEVDVITSVSGGSYTAAYYGLYGDRIFTEFKREFLNRDWQGELIRLAARPGSLVRTASGDYNRSDLVAAYLDRTLFAGATYRDLSQHDLPFIIINASDINNATTFSFIQQQFDFLCSDLAPYPVANAVMASSAVPGPFASMALRNYDGCNERNQPWVADALAHDSFLERRRAVALALERYAIPDRMPVVRLVDGGVTDNLGVRGSMMSPVAHYGNVPEMSGAFTRDQLQRVRNVLVVIANAQVYTETDWSLQGREPGLTAMLQSSFDSALGILNTETVSLAKQGFLMWEDHVNTMRGPDQAKVRVHFSILTFDQIESADVRRRFNAMPTTFRLQPAQVDALVAQSRELLQKSPEFVEFLHDVGNRHVEQAATP
ncbi:patatin-like phospholipase family protein [Pseudoxanthomonas japonensis]|uniref:patatin-like phospholipase family protein n=1 Tax=Pseudoxanthomonas japonensis TaxID=69284 RepID=UPI00374A6706